MATDDYTPHGDHPPTRQRRDLRLLAERCVRDEADEELIALVDELREDTEWWAHLWGPAAAVAAARAGREDALDLLRESIEAGFSQPELLEGELERHFSCAPDWTELEAQMAANVPPPELTLVDWPDAATYLPLELFIIPPERTHDFATRLPPSQSSAWDTAKAMLVWVRRQWEHANDHVDDPDALEVLERVDAGERFACVEYSIVLSQALNAVHIPARRLDLRQLHHHVGVGRGHVVSEAWIDDLDQWVVLDGQNGSYWEDADGKPMSLLALQQALGDGEVVRMVGLVDEMSESDSAVWLRYFASVSTTGYTWAADGFSPFFQGMGIIKTPRLIHDGTRVYPCLSDISVGLAGTIEEPALRLTTSHPYAVGFRMSDGTSSSDVSLECPRWAIPSCPGRHTVTVWTLTDYGESRPQSLTYERHEP